MRVLIDKLIVAELVSRVHSITFLEPQSALAFSQESLTEFRSKLVEFDPHLHNRYHPICA